MKKTITITKPVYKEDAGLCRISAQVNGSEVWYETSGTQLQPSAEAFASAFLVIALEQGADLIVEAPLSAQWLENSKFLMAAFRQWWKYPEIKISSLKGTTNLPPPGSQKAMCFTGGVDSFYTLLRTPHKLDELIYILGYDLPPNEKAVMDQYKGRLQMLSDITKIKVSVIRTNLRDHPLYAEASWLKTKGWLRCHGGALAAIGHSMPHIRQFVISSSYPIEYNHPWGSHWQTDQWWSSERLEIVHEGAKLWRSQKLAQIAGEPLVQKFLRVCTNYRSGKLNCCECEKCIRTMLILAQNKKLQECAAFEEQQNLLKNLQGLCIRDDLFPVYEAVCNGLEPQLREAVEDVLKRSKKGKILAIPIVGVAILALWPFLAKPIRQRLKKSLDV